MKKPLISIIVPNFNHAPFLKQRLDTVFSQTFQDFEVILLDDCSTDNSVEILTVYAKNVKVSHFIINKENSGSPFKQWKKGIDLAKGKYIWIAESDDYSEIEFLNTMIALLNKKESLGIAYCQSLIADDSGKAIGDKLNFTSEFEPNIWKNDFIIEGTEFINNYLSVKAVIPNTSAVIFEKSLVDSTVFDDTLLSMSICGDWLFWLKLCRKTKIAFSCEVLNNFRSHINTSRNHDSIIKKKKRIIEELQGRLYLYNSSNIKRLNKANNLYKNWFKLHKAKDLFKIEFYKVKMPFTNYISFVVKFILFKVLKKPLPQKGFVGSEKYWIDRYNKGGDSGAGSYNELAEFKGRIINEFVSKNNIKKILELGCGDGNQLKYFKFPSYIGFDVSTLIIEKCKSEFKQDKTKQFFHIDYLSNYKADLALSLDVIYHLIEEKVYFNYMNQLFDLSHLFVIIYSCNFEDTGNYPSHVKPRKFTDWVKKHKREFELIEHIPSVLSSLDNRDSKTILAHFYIYKKNLNKNLIK